MNPRILGKPRLCAARCANDQRHQSPWGEYMLDMVTFEGQIAVSEHSPGHSGILAGNEHVKPRTLGKPIFGCELQDAPMISAIGARRENIWSIR